MNAPRLALELQKNGSRLAVSLVFAADHATPRASQSGRVRAEMVKLDVSLVVADDAQSQECYELVVDTVTSTLCQEPGRVPAEARTEAIESCRRATAECGDQRGVYSVLDERGHHVGYVWIAERHRPDPKTLHIFFLTTFRASRRRGIGKGALTEIERMARERGMSAVTLSVSPLNTSAIRMYEAAGFVPYPDGMVLWLNNG